MGGMSNGWDHKVRNHGAFEIQQFTWAFRQLAAETDDPVVRKMLDLDSINHWLTVMPDQEGTQSALGRAKFRRLYSRNDDARRL